MKYKTANILGFLLIQLGIIVFGISIMYFQSNVNIGTIIGITITVIGFLIRIIFYRCPQCGAMITWRPLNIKYCQNCGQKL